MRKPVVRWLKQYPNHESEVLKDFGFCLLWITSDQIRQLDDWYRIPIVCMETLRTEIKTAWEKDGVYVGLHTANQVRILCSRLENTGQNPDHLLNWFLQTQLTPGKFGPNMIAWVSAIDECSRSEKLVSLSTSINSLYCECMLIPLRAYMDHAEKLDKLWIESTGHRTDWDEYLYTIYYKELCGTPAEIANEEVHVALFRNFWKKVSGELSNDAIHEFEKNIVHWNLSQESNRLKIDSLISIADSLGMRSFSRYL